MFDAIATAGSGLSTYRTWLDTIANNIANMNDTAPTSGTVFRTQYVQASAVGNGSPGSGNGVAVTGLTQSSTNGVVVQDPTNPIADAAGNVLHTDVNLSDQMGEMIAAQRAFQANASVVDRAKDTYEAALSIGKGM
jgi:flagellar basal-body rod protein FlgC